MTQEEIIKLLKEAHEHGYNDGWIKGKDSGIRSIAIGVDPGHPNKAKSWENFKARLNFK